MHDLILDLRTLVDVLPLAVQVLALLGIGLVPFLEGDVAAGIGVVVGVPWVLTVAASFAGTALASVVAVALGARVRGERRQDHQVRDGRILGRVERFGVPVAMLVGGFFLSVVVHAFVMSAARLHRPTVLVSALVSAAVNTVFVALVASGVLEVLL